MLTPTVFAQTLRQHVRPRAGTSIAAARAFHSTARLANSSNASSHPFSFLPANSLEPKATRNKALTEIRGPYYAPGTQTYLDELLTDWGEYVDGVKW